MKKRSLTLLVILIIIFIVLVNYKGNTKSFFLDFINPLKIEYLKLTNISSNYLKQQKDIEKLQKENNKLKILLIEQSNYLDELSKIYKLLPSLAKKPYKSIYLTDTISYVKLNKLNEIILTKPKNMKIEEHHPYGLMQNDVVAGVAQYKNGNLYGYLITHPKCTFSVVIGSDKIQGVAQGNNKDGMTVKFIPRWAKIKIGDLVKTSGLDNIFYPNIPVGEVTAIEVLDIYKKAKIRIFANIRKPSTFFLISDSRPYMTTDYMPDTSFPNKVYPFVPTDTNRTVSNQASQTQEDIVEPHSLDEQDYIKLFGSGLIWQDRLEFEHEEDEGQSQDSSVKKFNPSF